MGKVGITPSKIKRNKAGAFTPAHIKYGKGGQKLPLRLKLTKPGFDTCSNKRWQRWALTAASAKASKDGYRCQALKLSLEAVKS
jgi:hypothetical protein